MAPAIKINLKRKKMQILCLRWLKHWKPLVPLNWKLKKRRKRKRSRRKL